MKATTAKAFKSYIQEAKAMRGNGIRTAGNNVDTKTMGGLSHGR
jgi:hypothetical protein